jgi:hypothetical protein
MQHGRNRDKIEFSNLKLPNVDIFSVTFTLKGILVHENQGGNMQVTICGERYILTHMSFFWKCKYQQVRKAPALNCRLVFPFHLMMYRYVLFSSFTEVLIMVVIPEKCP